MKRLVCATLIAVACAACGGSSAAPTPRPSGARGPILNPIDKARDTADRGEDNMSEVQRYGGEYEQGNPEP